MPNILRFFMFLFMLPTMMSFHSHYTLLLNNRSLAKKSLRMSLSNKYLDKLSDYESSKIEDSLYKKTKGANETECENLEITGVVFNIYKLKNIFFSRRSSSIMFNLKDNMKNIYYINNTDVQRVSDKTKVTSQFLKSFHIVEFDPDYDIDAFVFKK